jgi:putative hemolysin
MMLSYLAHILAVAASVAAVAFFAGSEISFVSSSRFRVKGMVTKGIKGASTAEWLLSKPATILSVTLVGTNIFVVLASALMTDLLSRSLGPYSVLVSTGVATSLILLFGEIIPKAIARRNPESFLVRTAPGLGFAYYVLYPIAKMTSMAGSAFVKLSPSKETGGTVTRDEIRAVVKEAAQARFGLASRSYAHRVLDLSRVKVASVMLPMDEVVCIDEEATVSETLDIASRSGHSRYPVYKRTSDNLVGILYVKDLLGAQGGLKVRIFARSAYFIPETMSVRNAMREMRQELRHLAIVTDEYGRAIGILTFEDLVEEIVGEISDEYDRVGELPLEIGQTISGSTPISSVNEELDIGIPDGPYRTVAGFILDRAGAMCSAGDMIEFGDYQFHVIEVARRRIRRVRITRRKD